MSDLHPGLNLTGEPDPNYSFKDDRTWVTRELVLQKQVEELSAERDFLRKMLEAALKVDEE